ncbi:hypothetical protein COU60_00340 [Candidatus Pacearchaeota archaeon CG10_big_fil_rev_8_21_14_0_10_34_76]|nr:MAG: hypothetical protein COU60_00340 [Candidatus Pacearchaeota archaeon CG10_big_fil_rev_8_21_14_0_10_34_76]
MKSNNKSGRLRNNLVLGATGLSLAIGGCTSFVEVSPVREYRPSYSAESLVQGRVDENYVKQVVDLNSSNFDDFVEDGNKVVAFWNGYESGNYGFGAGTRWIEHLNSLEVVAEMVPYANFGRINVSENKNLGKKYYVTLDAHNWKNGSMIEMIYFRDGKPLIREDIGFERGLFRVRSICEDLYLQGKVPVEKTNSE